LKRSATFEPLTGRHLATVGGDKSIKIWTRDKRPEDGENWYFLLILILKIKIGVFGVLQ
jgi:hypothetical protein